MSSSKGKGSIILESESRMGTESGVQIWLEWEGKLPRPRVIRVRQELYSKDEVTINVFEYYLEKNKNEMPSVQQQSDGQGGGEEVPALARS